MFDLQDLLSVMCVWPCCVQDLNNYEIMRLLLFHDKHTHQNTHQTSPGDQSCWLCLFIKAQWYSDVVDFFTWHLGHEDKKSKKNIGN